MDEKMLTREEVAEMLQVCPRMVDKLRKERNLPATLLGRSVRFRQAAIRDWLRLQETQGQRTGKEGKHGQ